MSNCKFKIGDEIIVATDEDSLRNINITDYSVIGMCGEIYDWDFDAESNMNVYGIQSDDPNLNGYWFNEDMIRLVSDARPISIIKKDFETLFH